MTDETATQTDTRERDLFLAALERTDPAEQAAFLAQACGPDAGLRARLEELLQSERHAEGFLERPALTEPAGKFSGPARIGPGGTEILASIQEQPGDRIGRYKLLQKIGEGGCGVVYMAEQEEPVRRRVALKVIKLGMDTKTVIARFEAERQALALMDHPNIAKVLDAGATETGRPYFVMELVRGVKITEYCDQNNLIPRQRLELFVEVCQAIQHAHQKGIIHRDIKPSNILVTLHDSVPVPKVIDFGIAKATEQRLTDKTLFTEFTAFIGTPAYMSPEQAEMSGLDIDTRSDIYSLGVLLYELLTGKTPFDAEALLKSGLDECRRTIREKEPLRPSTRLETMLIPELTTTAEQRRTDAPRLIHLLRGDLDWVVMKCLEKDRTRRYDSATALAADVQRYLNDEPVVARPPSNLYRLQKLLHRHRGAVAATAGIAATLLIGAGVSAWQAVRATHAEHEAVRAQQTESQLRHLAEDQTQRLEQERRAARLNEYVADINLAERQLSDGNYGKALQLLRKHGPKAGDQEQPGFEWRYLWQICRGDADPGLPPQEGSVQTLACSPDGRWIAVGLRDRINIWERQTQARVAELHDGAFSLVFLPDGQTLVSGGMGQVRLWRTSDWTDRGRLPRSSGPVALSSDGGRLATGAMPAGRPFPGGAHRGIRIWNTSTWQEEQTLTDVSPPFAFSPDAHRLAAQSTEGIVLWPLDDTQSKIVLQRSTNVFLRFGAPVFSSDHLLAFSPDGKWVVAPRNTLSSQGVFVLSIWKAATGEEEACMPADPEHVEHNGAISSVVFLPNGTNLVTASWDHSIRLWDFSRRQLRRTLHGHLSEVQTVAFFAGGQMLLSGSKDGAVKLWNMQQSSKPPVLEGWDPFCFSSDSATLAVYKRPDTLGFYRLDTEELEVLALERREFGPRPPFSPPPGGSEGHEHEKDKRMPGPRGGGMGGEMNLSLSADLSIVAQGLHDGTVKFWNRKTRETNVLKVAEGRVDVVALSPDGSQLVTGARFPIGQVRALHWWDLRQGTDGILTSEASRVWFSADGKTLAAEQREAGIDLWDMTTHTLRSKVKLDTAAFAIAFSPDGQMLATTAGPEDPENAIHLWDVRTGKPIGTCTGHKQAVWSLAFSPDGATLASGSDDSTVRLWNIATQQELLFTRRLGGGLRELRFSPDGQWLVGGSGLFAQKSGLQFFWAPKLSARETGTERPPGAGAHKSAL